MSTPSDRSSPVMLQDALSDPAGFVAGMREIVVPGATLAHQNCADLLATVTQLELQLATTERVLVESRRRTDEAREICREVAIAAMSHLLALDAKENDPRRIGPRTVERLKAVLEAKLGDVRLASSAWHSQVSPETVGCPTCGKTLREVVAVEFDGVRWECRACGALVKPA